MAPRVLLHATAAALAAVLVACADPVPLSPAGGERAASPPGKAATAGTCHNPGAGPEPDAAGVRAFVKRNLEPVRDCYQRSLKRNPELAGKAVLRFTVGTCGQLADVQVASRGGNVSEAAACVARIARSWRTPFRPAEPVAVEYPLAFSAM